MPDHDYRYVIEFLRDDGSSVSHVPVTPDWEPALEWTHFLGIRQGALPAVMTIGPHAITPLWQPRFGEPYVRACRVVVTTHDTRTVTSEIPTAYFRGLAQQASSGLIEKGLLKPGEVFRYLVTAFATQQTGSRPEPLLDEPFAIQEVPQPLPLDEMPLACLADGALPWGEVNAEDYPVFVPAHILDEAMALKDKAGAAETGGILIGHLHRDLTIQEIFAEITAQIPARHTRAEATRLTFTAETWTSVQQALALRRKGEIMLGWWHTHPVRAWCQCPRERQRHCPLAAEFFSADDCTFQRTIFPRAYSVGLVLSDIPAETEPWTNSWALFGWRRGQIQARGFFVLGAPESAAAVASLPSYEGATLHATKTSSFSR